MSILILFCGASAKTKYSRQHHQADAAPLHPAEITIQELETALTPLFSAKLLQKSSRSVSLSGLALNDYSMMLIARNWDNLSSDFKALYKRATAIPDTFLSAVSPGGHFEIYYTRTGVDSVDITDLYGFGAGDNWRERTTIPNGIPDYVDETAWALDSAWSMEVDRFAFEPPIPYTTSQHPSGRYKVLLRRLFDNDEYYDDDYGITYPQGKASAAPKGYSSTLEIRNSWPPSNWASLGYDKHPELAVRITAAHELFHAIEYAMSWNVIDNVELDDFPIGWIEGCGVLMEELAFDSINDYLQYSSWYFTYPEVQLLSPYGNKFTYTNILLLKYLFERTTSTPGIDFIRKVFVDNFNRQQPFAKLLEGTSELYGTTWTSLLNHFHTESFFSGLRSRQGTFIADAPLLENWKYPLESPKESYVKRSTVNPYGMSRFGISPSQTPGDTVFITFSGELPADTPADNLWAVSFISRANDHGDSLFTLPIGTHGSGSIALPSNKDRTELIAIVTNGNQSTARTCNMFFDFCPVYLDSGEYISVATKPASGNLFAKADVYADTTLRCTIDLHEQPTDSLENTPVPSTLTPVSPVYTLIYPASWSDHATIGFTICIPAATTDIDRTALYHFNDGSNTWQKHPSQFTSDADTLFWKTTPDSPGNYMLAKTTTTEAKKMVIMYPNPLHLHRAGPLMIQGDNLQAVRIYSIDGTLAQLYQDDKSDFNNSLYSWHLHNRNGRTVTPGIYTVIIYQRDPATHVDHISKRKLLVIP